MPASGPRPGQVAVQVSLAAIFVSLELSRSTWLITSLVPGGGDKMSKHSVRSGDIAELLTHFTKLQDKAHARAGASFPDHRHSGSRPGRLLDPSRAGSGRHWAPSSLRISK